MYFPQTRCRESVGTCGGYVQVFQPNFQYHLLISLFTPPISLVTPYRRGRTEAVLKLEPITRSREEAAKTYRQRIFFGAL